MKLPNISLYWACQLLGWGSVAMYWSFFTFNNPALTKPEALLSVTLSFLMVVISSHVYKLLSHRYGWHSKPIHKLLPIMILGTLSLLSIYLIFNFTLSVLLYPLPLNRTTFVNTIPGMLTGGLRYNAIWILAFHLYHYAKRESVIEIEKTRLENEAIKAQLHQLTAELNPHFLFNSLNSIKALVNLEPEKARHAIVLLSEILRHALQSSKQEKITLEDELQQVKKYLELEKIRFEERLIYSFDIGQEAKSATILPFSIFNLVENAIKHGISQNINGGEIQISAHIVRNDLNVTVKNTGQLQTVSENGIGLKNIKERLQLLYGNNAQFKLTDDTPNQVSAILQIPLSYG